MDFLNQQYLTSFSLQYTLLLMEKLYVDLHGVCIQKGYLLFIKNGYIYGHSNKNHLKPH